MRFLHLIFGDQQKLILIGKNNFMSTQLFIFSVIFLPLLVLFIFINIRHNYINKDKKFEIIASPIYFILIFISTIWFTYVLIIGLDPHFQIFLQLFLICCRLLKPLNFLNCILQHMISKIITRNTFVCPTRKLYEACINAGYIKHIVRLQLFFFMKL